MSLRVSRNILFKGSPCRMEVNIFENSEELEKIVENVDTFRRLIEELERVGYRVKLLEGPVTCYEDDTCTIDHYYWILKDSNLIASIIIIERTVKRQV